jgi:NAD(P)-dependent dehydrogenase (short-subunit alcohol dehydrogenase family)
MINPMELSGRNILVMGASSGIGRETAIQLSRLGASVVLAARSVDGLAETLGMLEGGGHKSLPCDLQDVKSIEAFMNEAAGDGRKLDGLVYCAGIDDMRPLQSVTPDALSKVMTVNFMAFFELVRVFSKKKYNNGGGSIVAISSTASLRGNKTLAAYSASKAAIDGAIRPLSLELAAKNIRINSVKPGYTDTNMYKSFTGMVGEDTAAQITAKQFLGIVKPVDVANAIAFLLSDASRFITGSSIHVDGGYLVQ